MSAEKFQPIGRVSVADACMEIIRELAEGDGISKNVCLEEVRSRTERSDISIEVVTSDMLTASERLLDESIPGVFAIRGKGWQRMKPADVVAYMRARERSEQRQRERRYRAVDVIEDAESLSWQDRETLRLTSEARRRQLELDGKRSRRLRPLSQASGE